MKTTNQKPIKTVLTIYDKRHIPAGYQVTEGGRFKFYFKDELDASNLEFVPLTCQALDFELCVYNATHQSGGNLPPANTPERAAIRSAMIEQMRKSGCPCF